MRVIRISRPEWQTHAICRDTVGQQHLRRFFPSPGASTTPAKTICAQCPVRLECLDHALADPTLQGVWGDTTENERDRLRARRTTA